MKTCVVVVAAALILTIGSGVEAADSGRVYRIGALNGSTPAKTMHMWEAFRQGLRENGLVEGKNVVIEYRWAKGKLERFAEFADELVALNVDVIVSPPTPGALAALRATREVPIVFVLASDPVGDGLVKSLRRPGGNATGLSTVALDIGPKRLELLKEAFPKIQRVAVIYLTTEVSNRRRLEASEEAAPLLGLSLVPIGIERPADIEPAFAAAKAAKADAFVIMESLTTFTARKKLIELARQSGLPAIYGMREFVDDGGLMAYAVNTPNQFYRAATYVAKILRGADPASLPVEQPTRVDFVVNLRTAGAEGHKISKSLLLRADDVIE